MQRLPQVLHLSSLRPSSVGLTLNAFPGLRKEMSPYGVQVLLHERFLKPRIHFGCSHVGRTFITRGIDPDRKTIQDPIENQVSEEFVIGRCKGCGSLLQSEDETAFGYIPPQDTMKGSKSKKPNYRSNRDYSFLFPEEQKLMGEIREKEAELRKAKYKEMEDIQKFLAEKDEEEGDEEGLDIDFEGINPERVSEITSLFSKAITSLDALPDKEGIEFTLKEIDRSVREPKAEEPQEEKNPFPQIQEDQLDDANFEKILEMDKKVVQERVIQRRKEQELLKERLREIAMREKEGLPASSSIIEGIEAPIEEVPKPKQTVCQRCFSLQHYGQVTPVSVPIETFFHKLKDLRHSGKKFMILKVVDLCDFNGSFIPHFSKIAGSNSVVLVCNKVDLLPRKLSMSRVRQWVFREAKEKRLDVEDVFLVSSKTGLGMQELIDKIPQLRKGMDLYVMGTSNSGKSTFINWILQNARENSKDSKEVSKPVSSFLPGTTLNLISIPLKQGFLFDTPGIHNKHHIANLLTPKELKHVAPSKSIRPVNYTLVPGKTLFLAGLGRIDYLSGPEAVFTAFVSNTLYIHSTSTANAEKVYEKHQGGMLSPPIGRKLAESLVYHQLELKGQDWKTPCVDIVYPGLGWISVTGKGEMKVRAWSPKSVGISLRKHPLLPFEKPKSGKFRKVPPLNPTAQNV